MKKRELGETDILQTARTKLQKYFKYSDFTEEQERCIKNILSGKDVLVLMPTGAGKSLCYQIPALCFQGLTIVVTPLLSLMQDQVERMTLLEEERGLKQTANFLGSIQKSNRQVLIRAARGQYKLLYVSPERLENPVFLRFIKKVKIDFVAIDEAHCISMWGYDFRPRYLNIIRFIRRLKKRPVIGAFTATATHAITEDIIRLLRLDLKKDGLIKGGFRRDNLCFSIKKVKGNAEKKRELEKYLESHKGEKGIIYCSTTYEVDRLYDFLLKNQNVAKYHGNCDKNERKENYDKFMRDKECSLMVATNAFGMGIHKKDVRFVIHYNMPKDIESYYQEAGRAGRDGNMAECILLYFRRPEKMDDYKICEDFLEDFKKSNHFRKEVSEYRYQLGKHRLDKMEEYCEKADCGSKELQDFIEDYFEMPLPENLSSSEYIEMEKEELEKKIKEIFVLYYNNTKIANKIRKGEYTPGEEKQVDCGRNRKVKRWENEEWEKEKISVSYKIGSKDGEKLTYFDMMVADAVYTLEVNDVPALYPKKIYELLSGDLGVTLKPDKKAAIEESLEKMRNMPIVIDCSEAMDKGYIYDDEKKNRIYEGRFLPLEKRGEKGYCYTELPPLYRFATAFNIKGQFLTFSMDKLRILDAKGVKLPAAEENIKIACYLLWRISILKGKKGMGSHKNSRTIRYDTLFQTTGIEETLPEDKYSRKRKQDTLCKKVDLILNYYKNIEHIDGYRYVVDEYTSSKKKEQIKGVEIEFITPEIF